MSHALISSISAKAKFSDLLFLMYFLFVNLQHLASSEGHIEIVEYFIEKNANFSARFELDNVLSHSLRTAQCDFFFLCFLLIN